MRTVENRKLSNIELLEMCEYGDESVAEALRPFWRHTDERGRAVFHVDQYYFRDYSGGSISLEEALNRLCLGGDNVTLLGELVAASTPSRLSIKTKDLCGYFIDLDWDDSAVWLFNKTKCYKLVGPITLVNYEYCSVCVKKTKDSSNNLTNVELIDSVLRRRSQRMISNEKQTMYATVGTNMPVRLKSIDHVLRIYSSQEDEIEYEHIIRDKSCTDRRVASFSSSAGFIVNGIGNVYDWPNTEGYTWRLVTDYSITCNGKIMPLPSFADLEDSAVKYTLTGRMLPANFSSSSSTIPLNVEVEIDALLVECDIKDRGYWVMNVNDSMVLYKLHGQPAAQYSAYAEEAANLFKLYDAIPLLGTLDTRSKKFDIREPVEKLHAVSNGAFNLDYIRNNKGFIMAYVEDFVDLRLSKTFAKSMKELKAVEPSLVLNKRLRDDAEEKKSAKIVRTNESEVSVAKSSSSVSVSIPVETASTANKNSAAKSSGIVSGLGVIKKPVTISTVPPPSLSQAKMAEMLKREDERLQASRKSSLNLLAGFLNPVHKPEWNSLSSGFPDVIKSAVSKGLKGSKKPGKIRFSIKEEDQDHLEAKPRMKGCMKPSNSHSAHVNHDYDDFIGWQDDESIESTDDVNNRTPPMAEEEDDWNGPTAYDSWLQELNQQQEAIEYSEEKKPIEEDSRPVDTVRTPRLIIVKDDSEAVSSEHTHSSEGDVEVAPSAVTLGNTPDESLKITVVASSTPIEPVPPPLVASTAATAATASGDVNPITTASPSSCIPSPPKPPTDRKKMSHCTLCSRTGHALALCIVPLYKTAACELTTYHDCFQNRRHYDRYCISCDTCGHYFTQCLQKKPSCGLCKKEHLDQYCGKTQFQLLSGPSQVQKMIDSQCDALKTNKQFMATVMPIPLISQLDRINFCINCGQTGHHYRNCTAEISVCSYCGRNNHKVEYCYVKEVNDTTVRCHQNLTEVCVNCDETTHKSWNCKYYFIPCGKCSQRGHLEKYCEIPQYTRLNSHIRSVSNSNDGAEIGKPMVMPMKGKSSSGLSNCSVEPYEPPADTSQSLCLPIERVESQASSSKVIVLRSDPKESKGTVRHNKDGSVQCCPTCGKNHAVAQCITRMYLKRIGVSLDANSTHCINCNKGGHLAKECWLPPLHCYHCRQKGHNYRFCVEIQELAYSNMLKVKLFFNENISKEKKAN